MTAEELEKHLRSSIPLARDIDVRVVRADADAVVLDAPLEPNRNHHGTAFGGSVSTIAILAAWSYVETRLGLEGHEGQTVIQESTVRYVRPVVDTLRATATAPEPAEWARFVRTLEKRGRGRIWIDATLDSEGATAVHFRGAFVTATD